MSQVFSFLRGRLRAESLSKAFGFIKCFHSFEVGFGLC